MKLKSVLVTGGAGFIGSQLIKRILPLCDHIYVIDNLSTGRRDAVPCLSKITFIEDSITNIQVLQQVMPKVDYIFHLACSNLLKSVDNLELDFNTNLYGSYLLLQYAHKYCEHIKRFVYTSTTSIYGDALLLPTPETYFDIKLPYAASKFSAEHYCAVYHHLHKLPTSILRLSNAFGPGQTTDNPYCGVIARFFEAALEQKPLTIYGDGHQTRDFTFIDDTIDAILLAAEHKTAIGQIYNVGTEQETSVIMLAKMILAITGCGNAQINYEARRPIDIVARRRIDAQRIKEDLNWSVRHPIIAGLTKTYEWLRLAETETQNVGWK